jgi:nucleotide-binding universal stress UspA family protein
MISIERILCPTNLPSQADEALRYALALARAYHAQLLLCHCVETLPLVAGTGLEPARRNFEVASQLQALLPEGLDAPVCETLVVEGDPALAIPRVAAERRADLVVMRSRRRPLAAALLGSTAEAVCRTAPCPVLVTHRDERDWVAQTDGEIELRRILVAHDFSNDAELAFNYGLLLAQEYQTELHLLHVLPYAPAPALATMPAGGAGAFHQAARRLQHAVPAEAFLWCEVKQAVRSGQPYREILSYAEEHEIDLICLGVHGAGFSMRALFGSNADRVLRQAPCPVLIARPLKPLVPEVG